VGDYYRLVIEDNGPGITKEQLPKVFGKLLYGSRFHAREQSRGQQGIGISAAVLYSQLTSGQPAKITSRPKGQSRAQYFELIIDTDTNEPEIKADEETTWDRPTAPASNWRWRRTCAPQPAPRLRETHRGRQPPRGSSCASRDSTSR